MATTGLLNDVTVVDATQGYNGYTGKLLSDFGAEVVKVEPPGGDFARRIPPHTTAEPHPDSSAFFGFLNTGKRSLVVDPETDGETVLDLCSNADVLVEDGLDEYGITVADARERHPRLVVVSLGGFGRDGPHADRESTSIVAAATGGLMNLTGFPDDEPTVPGRSIASSLGTLYGAVGALIALRARETGGTGRVVDVSKQEAIAAHLESENTDYSYNGTIATRNGNRHAAGHPVGSVYPTANGHVCVCLFGTFVEGPMGGSDVSMWEPFCELIDREDLLTDARFNALPDDDVPGLVKRLENAEELDEILREELADVDAKEFYREAQESGISVSIVTTPPDVFDDPQLDAREFLTELPMPNGDRLTLPNSPYRFSNAEVGPSRAPKLDEFSSEFEAGSSSGPAPEAEPTAFEGEIDSTGGEPEATDGPLADLTVLDFTQVWAGPCGTKILADHGADVIKVESVQRPDVIRTTGPLYERRQGNPAYGEDRSGYFQSENRGKRSLAVNLKTDEGVQLVKDLVATGEIDVVTESFAPGAMERLGLGYETLEALDDSIVVCSVSGYGQEGPDSGYRAYGAMLGAHAGIAAMTGFPEGRPVSTGVAFVDPVTALGEAYGILAALHDRRRGGGGQYIDLSMREAGLMLAHHPLSYYQVDDVVVPRNGNRDELNRYVQGCYPTAGDDLEPPEEGWIVLAIRGDDDWRSLGDLLDDPDWMASDEFADQDARLANHDRLDERLSAWTRGENRFELVAKLQGASIPAGVVQSTRDLLENDPHLEARGFWEVLDHHVIGEQPYPGPLPLLEPPTGSIDSPAPMLGEHSRKILYELLDVSGDDIESLEDGGVLE